MDSKAILLERAKRFGLDAPELEQEKLKARAKRFSADHPAVLEEKMAERAKRFGMVAMDDKARMQQRALRFGLNNPAGSAAGEKVGALGGSGRATGRDRWVIAL